MGRYFDDEYSKTGLYKYEGEYYPYSACLLDGRVFNSMKDMWLTCCEEIFGEKMTLQKFYSKIPSDGYLYVNGHVIVRIRWLAMYNEWKDASKKRGYLKQYEKEIEVTQNKIEQLSNDWDSPVSQLVQPSKEQTEPVSREHDIIEALQGIKHEILELRLSLGIG